MCKRGFTLIEILVVMVVVGIIASMVVTSIDSARQSANLASCANNLRQIGLALGAYKSRMGKGRRFPTSQGSRYGYATEGLGGHKTIECLFQGPNPVLRDTTNLQCPADDIFTPNEFNQPQSPFTFDVGQTSYLYTLGGPPGGGVNDRIDTDLLAKYLFAGDRQTNHAGGINFLYYSGKIEFFDHDQLDDYFFDPEEDPDGILYQDEETVILSP